MKDKKVVDLIHIDKKENPEVLLTEYSQEVEKWTNKLRELQEKYFQDHFDSSSDDIQEIMAIRRFIKQFLGKRLSDINKYSDPMKSKYAQTLCMFYSQESIKNLFTHFFQVVEDSRTNSITFKERNLLERELGILMDIFMLRNTIESITTIQKSLLSSDPFPSIFSLEKRKEALKTLKDTFKILFQRCVKPDYRLELFKNISSDYFTPKSFLALKEEKKNYIFQHVLEKYDYRNQFFLIYFSEGMRAKIGGEIREYRFNYLDYEIIKQEFLTNWLTVRLKNNSKKQEVYSKYTFGGKTIAEILSTYPEKEIELLQQLPTEVFNDITAEIEEQVDSDLKSGVSSGSQKFGDLTKAKEAFAQTSKLLKSSLKSLKEFVSSSILSPSKSKDDVSEKVVDKSSITPPEVKLEPSYKIIKLSKEEIDFPYLVKATNQFNVKLHHFKAKFGDEYGKFIAKVSKLLNTSSERSIIKRRTPKHEWSLPFLIEETIGEEKYSHLLIVGAEAKGKPLGMGYKAKQGEQFNFTPYLIYGRDEEEADFKETIDQRLIRGRNFLCHDSISSDTYPTVEKFFEMVIEKELKSTSLQKSLQEKSEIISELSDMKKS